MALKPGEKVMHRIVQKSKITLTTRTHSRARKLRTYKTDMRCISGGSVYCAAKHCILFTIIVLVVIVMAALT